MNSGIAGELESGMENNSPLNPEILPTTWMLFLLPLWFLSLSLTGEVLHGSRPSSCYLLCKSFLDTPRQIELLPLL